MIVSEVVGWVVADEVTHQSGWPTTQIEGNHSPTRTSPTSRVAFEVISQTLQLTIALRPRNSIRLCCESMVRLPAGNSGPHRHFSG